MTMQAVTEEPADTLNPLAGVTIKFGHRMMLFAFLGDEQLDKAQRAVGTVLILRTNTKHQFKAQSIDWDSVAKLSGYSVAAAKRAYKDLVEMGWLEITPRDDGREVYKVSRDRRHASILRAWEHHQRHHQPQDAEAV